MVEAALFPGYVFLCGPPGTASDALSTGHVARVIDVPDQIQLERELEAIARALNAGAAFDPYPYLAEGRRARVRSGPMQGIEGIVDKRGRSDRLVLLVQMLGQATSVQIDAALLEPAE